MKSKALKTLLTLIILGAIFLLGANFILSEEKGRDSEVVSVEVVTPTETETDEETAGNLQIRNEMFAGQTIPREEAFMAALHNMTHQKVQATPKWGVLEVTEERLTEMLHILDESEYDHKAFYRETLEKWLQGDFSNAVEVHNHIWNLQDGTVGEAKRLLTPEEEAAYIEQYLR